MFLRAPPGPDQSMQQINKAEWCSGKDPKLFRNSAQRLLYDSPFCFACSFLKNGYGALILILFTKGRKSHPVKGLQAACRRWKEAGRKVEPGHVKKGDIWPEARIL